MKTTITKIYNSEYTNYFEVEASINGERFLTIAVLSKSQIRSIFNLTDEEFEKLRR